MTVPVFPYLPGIAYPVEKLIGLYDTSKQIAMSGKEARFAYRTQPRYQYILSIDLLDSTGKWTGAVSYTQQALQAFYNSTLGSQGIFNFWDVDDNTAITQSFGNGDGTTTSFQLARAIGGYSDYIYSPITAGGSVIVTNPYSPGTTNAPYSVPLIYIGGVLKTLGADYTIGSTGIVTFTTAPAPAAALTWTGCYYWPCNFDDDSISMSKIFVGGWKVKKLSFTTRVF